MKRVTRAHRTSGDVAVGVVCLEKASVFSCNYSVWGTLGHPCKRKANKLEFVVSETTLRKLMSFHSCVSI